MAEPREHYRYGSWRISSAWPLPELPVHEGTGVALSIEPAPAADVTTGSEEPKGLDAEPTAAGYRLRTPGGEVFELDVRRRRIGVCGAPELSAAARHALLDQVLPRVLGHYGELVLHASAVYKDGAILAFVGESGSGKSTLAASFAAIGLAPAADDCVVLDTSESLVRAQPSYRGLRLWPDSAAQLSPTPLLPEGTADEGGKRRFEAARAEDTPAAPLAGLFILGKDRGGPPMVRRPGPAAAAIALTASSFALDPVHGLAGGARLSSFARIIEEVPVFELSYPRAYSALNRVRAAVLQAIHGG